MHTWTASTKQKIVEYLTKVDKTKLESLEENQCYILRDIVMPKCHKGHIIDNSCGGDKNCDSRRAGDKCLVQCGVNAYSIACYDQGCTSS